jgi:hypothetical protein
MKKKDKEFLSIYNTKNIHISTAITQTSYCYKYLKLKKILHFTKHLKKNIL